MRRLALAIVVATAGCGDVTPPADGSSAVVERSLVDMAEQRYRDCVVKLYPHGSGWSVVGVACAPVFGAHECQATITRGEALVMVSGLAGSDWASVREVRLVSPIVATGAKSP